jgi:hypothetical protein
MHSGNREGRAVTHYSKLRRVIAVVLLVAGAALLLLSTEVGAGLLAFGLGIALELTGLALERRG